MESPLSGTAIASPPSPMKRTPGLWDQPAPRPPRETAHPARPARAHGPTRASAGAWSSSRRASAPPGAAAPGRRHSSLAFVAFSLFSSSLAAPWPRLWGPFVLVDAILTPTREPSLISSQVQQGSGHLLALRRRRYVKSWVAGKLPLEWSSKALR